MDNFLESLNEVLAGELFVADSDTDIDREALSNLWAFSTTAVQAADMSAEAIHHFLEKIILGREQQILTRFGRGHPMVFYCWFDEQAIQLRFSLVSARFGRLPFRHMVQNVDDLEQIIFDFLKSPYLEGIPLADDSYEERDSWPPQRVWLRRLPAEIVE